MRRGSVIGPLILVVLGALFLMNNVRPDWSLIDIIGRYWPFLLIAWGGLRLIEVTFWALRGKALPVAGVSGGEWTLIVFIALVGSGMFIATNRWTGFGPVNVGVRGVEVFGETYDYGVDEQKFPAAKATRVVVENWRGNARVSSSDASEVRVSGRKTIRALRREDADEGNLVSQVEIVAQGDTIIIRTNQERARNERFLSVDLDIVVPRSVSVEGRGRHGDFDVTGVTGGVEIISDNAGVRLQQIGGNVRVDLRRSDIVKAIGVKGDVELKGRGNDVELEDIEGQVILSGAYGGELQFRNLAKPLRIDGMQTDVRMEKLPGQLRLGRGYLNAQNVVGPVVINGRSKDIEIEEFTNSLELTLDKGDIHLRPGRLPVGKMDVSTHSGRIDLALPDSAKFSLKAVTNKGEVENAFGDTVRVSEEGRGAVMTASVGDGPSISLSTDRGSISLRKSSAVDLASPLTPQPPAPKRLPAPERAPEPRRVPEPLQ